MNRPMIVSLISVLLLIALSYANAADDADDGWAAELDKITDAIAKSLPDTNEPLRKYAKEFGDDKKLKEAAVKSLRERAEKKGKKAVKDEIQEGTSEKKLKEINQQIKDGEQRIDQLGFPWCLLVGCA